jgi:hypothetical protein
LLRKLEISLVVALLAQGCPSDSKPEAADGGTNKNDAQVADPAAKVGTFTVELHAPTPATAESAAVPGFTSIAGKVYDGEVPAEALLEPDTQEGSCTLLKRRVPFCDPECEDGVCVEDGQCQRSPTPHSVGTLKLSGVKTDSGATEIEVKPIVASYSTPGGVKLLYPAFEEGDPVRLEAPGAEGPAFSLVAKGVAPLELTTESFPLKSDTPLAIAWKPPGDATLARIHVKMDISQHGGKLGQIQCDVADSGSLTIAANLISKLLELGVAGYPTIAVTRVATASTETSSGNIELRVTSIVERAVTIDGLNSCGGDEDCEAGHTCEWDLTCSK